MGNRWINLEGLHMKKLFTVLTMLVAALLMTACGGNTAQDTKAAPAKTETASTQTTPATDSKTLIVYFSAQGHTKQLAETTSKALGADLVEIVSKEPYTAHDLDYNDKTTRATVEQNNPAARPAIANKIENMAQYNTVIIAYPIWWAQEPRIVDTFVESYDFTGKTLVPICTSGGSDIGRSGEALAALTTGAATWKDGKRFAPTASADEIADYFKSIGVTQ